MMWRASPTDWIEIMLIQAVELTVHNNILKYANGTQEGFRNLRLLKDHPIIVWEPEREMG